MTSPTRRWSARTEGHSSSLAVAALAAIAYLPALLSSPGRMPADTKLYLYLDPGGLLGRATSTLESEQFAGWVPHQQITYLWPGGPWYRLFDAAGVPDWVAHRLWIGSIMFLAGWGVHRTAVRLGLRGSAALAAALLYQLSPFLLPYISRTSLLLLPWAGLGWIVGLTIGATARAAEGGDHDGWRRRLAPWREPALIALVVATVGSANATALALVAPAPVLWLVHAAWARVVTWREAAAIAMRTGVLCTLVSLWWMAMLVVQSRHGAPVLAYSETLADVSHSSTGSEVLRGLGYWLFYIRDPFGPATSSAIDYLTSTRMVAVGYAVTLTGLAGIAVTTSTFRRFAALLVAVGVVLSVGVHPIGASSPLISLLANDDGSGLALALRSSTRALPLVVLGLALGAGSLVAAIPHDALADRRPWRPRPRTVAAGAIVLLVLANLPSLWRFELVDPAIDRDQAPPAAWTEAAAALDADGRGRVLQLPGAEFGAFRWGYTVDQPLVALTDRPLITRDLLPLGSAAAMDLLYALDDRFQEGTAEAAAVAPVARLLGAGTVWVANDLEFERFRTPRPETVDGLLTDPPPPGMTGVRRFGEPFVSAPTVPMVDPASLADARVGTAIAPVVLVGVEDSPGVERVKTAPVIVAGSGDGLVDAAAAGIISGDELILYSASLSDADRTSQLQAGTPLVVTDSNRDRAHHWRGSQDVHGHTEPGGPDDDVLVATNADQRLAVFERDDPALQTIAVQDGPVTAVASAYGEPFAYLPEHRAAHAIDGDPDTAWLVGDHGDPVGERIRLHVAGSADSMTLRQPAPPPGGRRITAVAVTQDGTDSDEIELTDESTGPQGQRVELAIDGSGTVEIEITAVTTGDQAVAASRAGVGFSEVDVGLGPTVELIRPPAAALEDLAGGPLSIVLTRLRADPLDRWRADPEPRLARAFSLPAERAVGADVTLRLDRQADDAVIGALAGAARGAVADRRLSGAARHGGAAALDGDGSTSWITPIDGAVGATLSIPTIDPVGPVLELTQPVGDLVTITTLRIGDGRASYDLPVPPPDAGGRSTIELPRELAPGAVTLTVTGTDGATTVDRRFGEVVALPAAVAELSGAGLPITSRDDSTIVGRTCTPDLLELDGRPVPLSFETTLGRLLDGEPIAATVCGGPLALDAGEHRLVSTGRAATGLTVDRVVLADRAGDPAAGPAVAAAAGVVVDVDDARRRVVTVTDCPDGCWLVHGEGFNEAWSARVDGASLGPPTLVDGGFNGWRLPPAAGPVRVEISWTAQTPVTVGLLLSALGALACLVIAAVTRGRRPVLALAEPSPHWRRPVDRRGTAMASAIVLVVAGTLVIGPEWGAVSLVVGAALVLAARHTAVRAVDRLLELVGLSAALLVAVATIAILRRNRPRPDAGWTEGVERLNGLALFSVVCIAVGALGVSWSRRKGAAE